MVSTSYMDLMEDYLLHGHDGGLLRHGYDEYYLLLENSCLLPRHEVGEARADPTHDMRCDVM